jgi:alkylation response protein AidB-like acyl-CoA dehydrogenase
MRPGRARASATSWRCAKLYTIRGAGTPRGLTPKGLTIGRREPTMGLRGIPETEVIFENLVISEDMVLRNAAGVPHGFAELMNAYNSQRVGAATVALGLAQGAFEAATDFARERHQFGRTIGDFQGM